MAHGVCLSEAGEVVATPPHFPPAVVPLMRQSRLKTSIILALCSSTLMFYDTYTPSLLVSCRLYVFFFSFTELNRIGLADKWKIKSCKVLHCLTSGGPVHLVQMYYSPWLMNGWQIYFLSVSKNQFEFMRFTLLNTIKAQCV